MAQVNHVYVTNPSGVSEELPKPSPQVSHVYVTNISDISGGGGTGGAVNSVNGKIGNVNLTATDIPYQSTNVASALDTINDNILLAREQLKMESPFDLDITNEDTNVPLSNLTEFEKANPDWYEFISPDTLRIKKGLQHKFVTSGLLIDIIQDGIQPDEYIVMSMFTKDANDNIVGSGTFEIYANDYDPRADTLPVSVSGGIYFSEDTIFPVDVKFNFEITNMSSLTSTQLYELKLIVYCLEDSNIKDTSTIPIASVDSENSGHGYTQSQTNLYFNNSIRKLNSGLTNLSDQFFLKSGGVIAGSVEIRNTSTPLLVAPIPEDIYRTFLVGVERDGLGNEKTVVEIFTDTDSLNFKGINPITNDSIYLRMHPTSPLQLKQNSGVWRNLAFQDELDIYETTLSVDNKLDNLTIDNIRDIKVDRATNSIIAYDKNVDSLVNAIDLVSESTSYSKIEMLKTSNQNINASTSNFTDITFQNQTTNGTSFSRVTNAIKFNNDVENARITAVVRYDVIGVNSTFTGQATWQALKNGVVVREKVIDYNQEATSLEVSIEEYASFVTNDNITLRVKFTSTNPSATIRILPTTEFIGYKADSEVYKLPYTAVQKPDVYNEVVTVPQNVTFVDSSIISFTVDRKINVYPGGFVWNLKTDRTGGGQNSIGYLKMYVFFNNNQVASFNRSVKFDDYDDFPISNAQPYTIEAGTNVLITVKYTNTSENAVGPGTLSIPTHQYGLTGFPI